MRLPRLVRLALLSAALLLAPVVRAQEANFQRGCELFRREDYAGAAAAFQQCIAAKPNESKYHQWLGRALGLQAQRGGLVASLGTVGKIRAALEKAAELDPNNLEALEDLAMLYRMAPGVLGGSKEKAAEQLEAIRRRDPARAAQVEGNFLAGEKKYDEAAGAYRRAVRLNASRPAPWVALALLHQRAQEWSQAFECLDRALKLDPRDPQAIYQVGRTAALSGQQLERGEQALRTYLKMPLRYDRPTPSYSGAHFRLGNICEKRGDRLGAIAAYDQALPLDPKNKDAKAARAKL